MTKRPQSPALEQLMRARQSLGDGTLRGRARSATPPGWRKQAQTQRRVPGVVQGDADRDDPAETVHLRSASQVFPTAGDMLVWDEIRPGPNQAGFENVAGSLPSAQLVIEEDGYYDLHVQFEWDTYTAGGTVRALRDGVEVGKVASTKWGGLFSHVFPLGVCGVGSVIQVEVKPDV